MMQFALGRLEVTMSMAERAGSQRAPRPDTENTGAQRAYNRARNWRAVETERAARDAAMLIERSRTLR